MSRHRLHPLMNVRKVADALEDFLRSDFLASRLPASEVRPEAFRGVNEALRRTLAAPGTPAAASVPPALLDRAIAFVEAVSRAIEHPGRRKRVMSKSLREELSALHEAFYDRLDEWEEAEAAARASRAEIDLHRIEAPLGRRVVVIDVFQRIVSRRDGRSARLGEVEFALLGFLLAHPDGAERRAIVAALWPDGAAGNSFDQRKWCANERLRPLDLEIRSPRRGVWRLTWIDQE